MKFCENEAKGNVHFELFQEKIDIFSKILRFDE